jgi:hypothetical protein
MITQIFTVNPEAGEPSTGDERPTLRGDGYATLVHSPHPNDETGVAAEELSEEMWPTGPEVALPDEEDDSFDTLKPRVDGVE